MMLSILLLMFVVGLVLLNKGSDWFVESCQRIAEKMHVSPFIVGFFGVAISTSLPEIASTLYAAYKGVGGIAVGNIVGSNIANIGLVFGIGMLGIRSMKVTRSERGGELEMLAITLLWSIFIFSGRFISRVEGFVSLLLFILYFYLWYNKEKKRRASEMKRKKVRANKLARKELALLYFGSVFVIFGAQLVVNSAAMIADALGITHTFIGMTAVAVGTSLPELFTTIAAMRKHYYELLVGDIVGSNVVNLLLALGGAAILRPMVVDFCGMVSTINMILITVIFTLMTLHKRYTRWEGIILLSLYFVFMYAAYVTA